MLHSLSDGADGESSSGCYLMSRVVTRVCFRSEPMMGSGYNVLSW